MNTNILGLRTVIYQVPNMEEAKKWYTKAFGKAPYFDEPFYMGFEIGGYELGLTPGKAPHKSDNVETYWGVTDIDLERQRFLELGAREHTAKQDVGSDILVCTLLDPWDNLIGLIYNPHFKLP